ncbi:reverse transcriptase domain-containing protein [Tanacetum coccineum]
MMEREAKQMPVYFVRRALQGLEINYTSMEKLVLALVHASKRLKRYFQARTIIVIMDQPIKQILSRPEVAGRLQKWSIELGKYDIQYRPRTLVKGQILADFIVERPEDVPLDTPTEAEEELLDPWTLFMDGSSCVDGSGAGLILTNPKGAEFMYALWFRFDATNNEAEYEALIDGLKIAEQMGVKISKQMWTLHACWNKIHSSKGHTDRILWQTMHVDAKKLIRTCQDCQVHRPVPRNPQQKLTPIMSSWSFYKWGIYIVGPFPKGPEKVKFLIVAMDYFTIWIEAKSVTTITGNQVKKFVWDNIVCMFGLSGEIISDNEKQFRDNPFKDWCEKLCIRQCFASVKHPQANRNLGERIKARLDERSKDWIEELSHVLWAHCTMIKSSNGDTPFLLTYGTEVVIPAEIGMPTIRKTKVNIVQNDEAMEINLDLLEERREQAAIRKAKSNAKMEKYYNSNVRNTIFKPEDLVYRRNEAIHAKESEKLSPKWEGPYEVTENTRQRGVQAQGLKWIDPSANLKRL